MSDFNSTDLAVAIEALAVTIHNFQQDSPEVMMKEEWDELLRVVGEDLYQAGGRRDTTSVVWNLSKATGMMPRHLQTKSMKARVSDVLVNRDRW